MKKYLITAILILTLFPNFLIADEIRLCLTEPSQYDIRNSNEGDLIEIQGYTNDNMIGEPLLPIKLIKIALPPNVDRDSVRVIEIAKTEIKLANTVDIAPAAPFANFHGVDWAGKTNIVNGRDMDIYGLDRYYPDNTLKIQSISQMRKWIYAVVEYSPVRFNPVSGEAYVTSRIDFNLTYNLHRTPANNLLLQDVMFDEYAAKTFTNFSTAQSWYQGSGSGSRAMPSRHGETYLIVSPASYIAHSLKMSDFIQHKEALGFTVKVITEADFGTDQGQQRVVNIREWLQNNYIIDNIKYVLLIGNPNPDDPSRSNDSYGDMPMMMCWPRRRSSSYKESPTDSFLADLTGDWDLDNDDFYGEFPDDRGNNGVDFTAEVIVGRIPIYSNNYAMLDSILEKIIDYQTVALPIPAWRYKVLTAAAFSNFEKEDGRNRAETDKAKLVMAMIDGFIDRRNYDFFRLFEREGVKESDFQCESPLTENNVVDEWKKGYGLVSLNGHGSNSGIYRKYWVHDNGDKIPRSSEIGWKTFFKSSRATELDDSKPSITFNCACNNGFPEDSNNLGAKMLYNGSVATVTSSRVSWYWLGWAGPSEVTSNQNMTYYFFEKITQNSSISAGEALFWEKEFLSSSRDYYWMNKFDFNLYGDPSVSLRENIHNEAPTAYDNNFRTRENTPCRIQLNASDPQADPLIFKVSVPASHGTVEISGNSAFYTPDKDFTGFDQFTFIATDGFLDSNSATIDILVNNPPFASDSIEVLNEDENHPIKLLYVEENGHHLDLIITTQPKHGTLVGDLDNLIFFPESNYFGYDFFEFKLNDGFEESKTALVQLNIMPVNDAPTLQPIVKKLKGWRKVRIPLEIIDIDSDEFIVQIRKEPFYGKLEIDDTDLIYTPHHINHKDDLMLIKVCDFKGGETLDVEVKIVLAKSNMRGCYFSQDSSPSLIFVLILTLTLVLLRIANRFRFKLENKTN